MQPPPPQARRRKILIVDDNPVILQTLSVKLKSSGYDVATAQEGSLAIAAVGSEEPDLILLDISFPPEVSGVPWDGFAIMEWLDRVYDGINIPVIIITSGDPAKYKDRAMAAGASGFFQKPIDPDELLSTINAILSRKR